MRFVKLGQLGLLGAVAAGAGIGCGEEGTTTSTATSTSTTSATAELKPMPKPRFESIVRQGNTVSNQANVAKVMDDQLQNVWGIAFRGDSIWLTANHTGTDRQYSEDGKLGEVITMIDGDGMTLASPTGQVVNPFPHAFMGDTFIAASEDGDIFGVNPGTPLADIRVPNEGAAIYKGDAIAMFHGRPRLFATDFHNRKVDAFEADYSPATLGGDFVDPELATLTEVGAPLDDGTIPIEMYAPFNIMPFGDKLLVTFALQRAPDNGDDEAGAGHGFVDVFDTDGHYVKRLLTRDKLNSPWGMALSREHNGDLDLMVGNFGDGHINVYAISIFAKRPSAAFEGALGNRMGQANFIEGLWGIAFGSGQGGFGKDDLYFAAGPGNGQGVGIEDNGLFGELDFGPRR
jgi:uncharacterized protein (TIGR03118 family)